ncbi:unnamed protein product, partial [Symbiodinium necroappetens]
MALEDSVYVICEGSSGPLSICGWVVSLPGDDAVVGTSTKATAGLAHTAKAKQGEHEISFVRVPLSAVTEQPPSEWKGVKPRDLPPSKACVAAWKTLGQGGTELESSGAEMPRTSKAPGRARRSLKEDLKDLQGLWDDEEGDEDETDDEDDARPSTRPRGSSMLAPGAKNKDSDRREKERDEDDLDLRKLVRKGLASGQSPNDLMPLFMMSLALDKSEGRKKKKSKEAGRLGKGMQAVATLHRLHESIRKRPRRIIMQQFEAEVARELGVIPGQPWTLNDWVRRQSWGPKPQPQDADVQLVAKAERAYLEAKLQRAVHKEFRFETVFKAWGAEIDGVAGRVGAPLATRRQVWMLLQRIVTGGWASCDVLRQVLGNLAYIFQYRRELYSLQHRIYKFVSEMPGDRWCKLPDFVLDEIRSCALHLPFAVCSMRRRVSTTLLATDATPSSGGAVVTEVPGALAEELWRQSEMKGEAVRLDRGRDEALDVEEPKVPSVFASTVGECLPWRVTASYHSRETSHVNLQELRAWRREMMKIAARGDHKGCIVVALNDSRVVVGAVGKGRSSSFRLNNLLRGALPHMILGGLSGALLWIETAANPADYPSRFRALPPPRRVPGWLLNFGIKERVPLCGREVCVREARATQAHSEAGLEMSEPVDLIEAVDLQIATLFEEVTNGLVRWVWLEPFGLSFAARRHFTQVGPQGPSSRPVVDEWRLQGARLPRGSLCVCSPMLLGPKTSSESSVYFGVGKQVQGTRGKGSESARPSSAVRWHMPAYGGRLRNANLTPAYRRGLRAAAQWLFDLAASLGGKLTRSTPPPVIDRVLERCVDEAYQRGEKLYFVRLHSRELLGDYVGGLAQFRSSPQDEEAGGLVVTIRKPKTRRLWQTQFVLVKSPALIKWLAWWTADMQGDRLLFRVARRRWARLFAEGLARLHLGDRGFTLGSLRSGGATWHFRTYENLPKLQYLGRWARADTLKYYLHEALTIKVDAEGKPESKVAVISSALRELAAALENSEWDVVGLASQTQRAPLVQQVEAQKEVSGSTVAYRQDWRIYVVVANPKQPERVGVAQDAGAGDLKGAAEAIMTAVGSAADQLGTAEVDAGRTAAEILGDEASRASAARWRSGSVHRRLTATLARLMTSLQQWTSLTPAAPRQGTLAPVQPRPLRAAPSSSPSLQTPAQARGPWGSASLNWHRAWWWGTLALLVMMCLFPRIVALFVAMVVRLVLRGCFVLASHVIKELCAQTFTLAGELEAHMVDWLSGQLSLRTAQPQLPPNFAVPPAGHDPHNNNNNFAGPPAQVALPARPLDFVTWVLLACNIYQQRQQ